MEQTISQNKVKLQFAAKTKEVKALNKNKVSQAALAATSPENLLGNMALKKLPISSLKGLKKRARKSDKEQLERVSRSIALNKQCAPVLINQSSEIINGHLVVEALKGLGQEEVWCAVIDHLGDDECALLHVTLNRIGEKGDWDLGALGPLMIDLNEKGLEIETSGFSLPELDIILTPEFGVQVEPVSEPVPEPPIEPVSRLGDIWLLGEHRLLCGDATKLDAYVNVLDGEIADAIFADCPWNIPIEGFVSGLGQFKHKDFKQGAGEMSDSEFAEFCDVFHANCAQYLSEGGVGFTCIDWRSTDRVMSAGKAAGLQHINTVVWNKGSGGMGSLYRSGHEFVVVFCKGKSPAVNNIQLGKHGRDRTNVWTYAGANQIGSSAAKALAHHPTPKPIEMVHDALLDVTTRGSLVLDPFMGSGTTLLAAETSGRRAAGIELDPRYVDVAVQRWEKMTGQEAIHLEKDISFSDLADLRAETGDAEKGGKNDVKEI